MRTDRQLVEACLAGETQAFAALVDRYRYPVYGLCVGFTKDFDAAEDAAQEAFIASYLKLGNLHEPDGFGPWVKRIAINQCRMWRRRQRRLVPLTPEQEAVLADPARSPEDSIIRREQRQQVLGAIAGLSEAQQQAVVLFYLKELTLQQIADFLEVEPQTVEQRLYRARRKLKERRLDMVAATLEGTQLPEDFTDQVVAEAVSKGEQLLSEKDWAAAKTMFSRVTEALPDHAQAHRGLGLALDGSVKAALREPKVFGNGELVQETFAALERAYHLGTADDKVVNALSGLYQRFGRHREGGEFLEAEAARRTDWYEQIRLLGRAIGLFYHAYYKDDSSNMESCVRCHRRMRALVPADMEPRRKLSAWTPGGMSLAYAHMGLSQEVFDELEALRDAIAGEWSVYDHFCYTLAYSNQHRETKQWAACVAQGREFVDWAKGIPSDDRRMFLEALQLDGRTDTPERHKVGEWVRWWTILYTLHEMIKAEVQAGSDTGTTFADVELALERHEQHVGSADDNESVEQSQERLAGNYLIGGSAAYGSGRYAKAVEWFERAQELLGTLGAGPEPLYAAASLVSLGEVDAAKDYLQKMDNRRITIGIGRAEFEACRELDAVRNDPDIIALVESWKRAETLAAS